MGLRGGVATLTLWGKETGRRTSNHADRRTQGGNVPFLERDIVILEGGLLIPATAGHRLGGNVAAAAPFAFRGKHLHLLPHDFGGVPLVAAVVLPLAGLQSPLDVDGLALGEVFAGDLGKPGPEGDAVPLDRKSVV